MTLYYSTGACSLAAHIALMEMGGSFKAEKVDLRTKHYSGGDFKTINPKGYVPALQLDNGELLTEVPAVLQYLGDQNTQLIPRPGTWERYRAVEWLNYVSTEIHKSFSILFGADGMVSNKEGNEQLKGSAREALGKKFTYLAHHLEQQPFLMGESFTVADMYLFVCLRWSGMMGLDLTKWSPLQDYYQRILARPKVQEAMKAEGLKLK